MNTQAFYDLGVSADESSIVYKELRENMQNNVWYYKTTSGKWFKKRTNNPGYTVFSFPYNAFKDEDIHPEIEELHFKDYSVSKFFVKNCPNLKVFQFHSITRVVYEMGLNERLDSLQRVLIPESFKNSLISSGRVHFSNGTSYYASGLTLPASFNINNLIGV